jgi:hypothetical protein
MSEAALPAPPPAADEPDDQKQYDRADRGVDDRADEAGAKMKSDPGQEPMADESADNANGEIANQAEAGAADNFAGQPPSDNADNDNNNEALIRKVHNFSWLAFVRREIKF